MLLWVFGKPTQPPEAVVREDQASGVLHLERAKVNWKLSINADHLPAKVAAAGKRTYRSLVIDGREIEFSDGFTDLHTACYRDILDGKGFGIEDARPSIETVYSFRKRSKQP